jgi:hypothetical protein
MSGIAAAFGYDNLLRSTKGAKDYYDIPSFKDYAKGESAKLKSGYISSSTPLHSGYGNPVYSQKSTRYVSRRNPKTGDTYSTRPGVYIYKDPKAAEQQRQQAYQQQLQDTAARTQADIAKQLQIVQSEKSAVSKMTQEYTKMLQEEADRRVEAEEKARVSAATSAANQARQGQTTNLQIQPAASTPQTAGTQPFKRRKDQFKINTPTYSGLSISQSGMVNV